MSARNCADEAAMDSTVPYTSGPVAWVGRVIENETTTRLLSLLSNWKYLNKSGLGMLGLTECLSLISWKVSMRQSQE